MNTHSNKHKPCFQSLTYLILMLGLFLATSLVLRFFYVEISISISRKLYILNRIKSIFLGKENVISKKKEEDLLHLPGTNSQTHYRCMFFNI